MATTLPDLHTEPETLPVKLAPIGYLRSGAPIWPVSGAEGDDDEDDDTEVDDDTIDTGDGEGDAEKDGDGKKVEYKAPTEEEWKRTQNALARANREAKKLRLKAKGATPKEDEDAATQAAAEAEKKFKPVAIRSAAKAAFLEAGLNDASPERVKKLLRLVDLDDVDVDDEGDVVGLDDQIDSIKDDYPELFATKQERKRTTRLDASNRQGGGSDRPKTTGEKIAARVLAGK